MKIFLLCTRESDVIRVISAKTFDDAYNETVASNDGVLLVELSDSVISDINRMRIRLDQN